LPSPRGIGSAQRGLPGRTAAVRGGAGAKRSALVRVHVSGSVRARVGIRACTRSRREAGGPSSAHRCAGSAPGR